MAKYGANKNKKNRLHVYFEQQDLDRIQSLIEAVNDTPQEYRTLFLLDEWESQSSFVRSCVKFTLDFLEPRAQSMIDLKRAKK